MAAPIPRVPPVTTATRAMMFPRLVDGRVAPVFTQTETRAVRRRRAVLKRLPFDAERDAHAAADAESGEALLGAAALHFMQQRREHARAGRADRVTDRDGAAVDV